MAREACPDDPAGGGQGVCRSEPRQDAGRKDDFAGRRIRRGRLRDAEKKDDLARLVAGAWAGRGAGRWAGRPKARDHGCRLASVRDSLWEAGRDCRSAWDVAAVLPDAPIPPPLDAAARRRAGRNIADAARVRRQFVRQGAKADHVARAPVAALGAFAAQEASLQ